MIIIYYRFEKNSRNENDVLVFFFLAFVPLVRSLCRGALAGMRKKTAAMRISYGIYRMAAVFL